MARNYHEEYKVDVPEGESGDWRVKKFVVPEQPTIENMRIALSGRETVPPGTYTGLWNGGHNPVMSDTPAEIRDFVWHISGVTGRVLIHGLGIGVVLKSLLRNDEVTHIDVVELSDDVIKLVWPTYEGDPRLSLHHGSAFTHKWPPSTRWDFVWHDIWPDLNEDNLAEMATLHRKFGRQCEQQASWGREFLEQDRRERSQARSTMWGPHDV